MPSSNGSLPELSSSRKRSTKKMIAICLIIVNELHHEDIWRYWIENGQLESEEYGAELIIHAKEPDRIRSEWVRGKLVQRSFCPQWNSPEVVRAILETLSTGIHSNEHSFERFIICTETCLPLYKLHDVGLMVTEDNQSWLNVRQLPESKWEMLNCFSPINPSIIPIKVNISHISSYYLNLFKHICFRLDGNHYQGGLC